MRRWSEDETNLLKHEAEHLARAGHSRPGISRQLGVPMHTLNRWAFEGGWRDKDMLAEQARARAEAMRQRLAERRAREAAINTRFGAVGRAPLLEPALETQALETKSAGPGPFSGRPSDPDPFDRLREIHAEEEDCPSWADRTPQVKTPPWAPGRSNEDPEQCALFLADDLMRQGLLVEAERALRFARRWADQWPRATARWDKEDEAHMRFREKADLEAELATRTRERMAAVVVAAAGGGAGVAGGAGGAAGGVAE